MLKYEYFGGEFLRLTTNYDTVVLKYIQRFRSCMIDWPDKGLIAVDWPVDAWQSWMT